MGEEMRIVWKKNVADRQVILSLYHEHALADAWILPDIKLRAGYFIQDKNCLLQCQSRIILVDPKGLQCPAWVCRLIQGTGMKGDYSCVARKQGHTLAWITLSDKGARGEREDTSGPTILELIQNKIDISFFLGVVIADDPNSLKAILVDLCLTQSFDFVFTTGGTGVGPRDITPDVTSPLLDSRLEGFERAMTLASIAKTAHGMISRAVAGTLGQSLVVNLPGSPKAVRENLEVICPALEHTVAKLQGDKSDCGR